MNDISSHRSGHSCSSAYVSGLISVRTWGYSPGILRTYHSRQKEFPMSKNISRRSAFISGSASAGALFGAACSNNTVPDATAQNDAHDAPLPNVWGEDFLM